MMGLALVRALEQEWRGRLDAVAGRHRWPTSAEVHRLGACVARLSAAYNEGGAANLRAPAAELLAARLSFSFPRDVPKGAAAVRELVAMRALAPRPGEPLRILDVGAGLGATTTGAARAIFAGRVATEIDALLVDQDAAALALAAEIAGAARAEHRPAADGSLRVRTAVAPVGSATLRFSPDERFDLVLLGQVLSELDATVEEGARAEKHASVVLRLAEEALAPNGAIAIVEPALRARTRHLHRVRDVLVRAGSGLRVFAPCTHEAGCPALARETDWCHEDLPIDLPPWLVPVARAAGLRFEGLTFSYLVLTRGPSLAELLARRDPGSRRARLRVVSDVFVSKGKREAFLCGEIDGTPARARTMRLDRQGSDANAAWGSIARGQVLAMAPPPLPWAGAGEAASEKPPRVSRDTSVTVELEEET